jgi:carboxyl-terminal processing protease
VLWTGASGQSAETASLTKKDREEIFSKVWKSIKDKYYDPGLNGTDWANVKEIYQVKAEQAASDPEFYATIKKMVGEIKDAHTRFLTPREAYEFKTRQITSAGITAENIEKNIVISRVTPDSEAAAAGLKPGMSIVEVDGVPVEERIAQLRGEVGESSSERASSILMLRKLLDGEPETKVRLKVLDFDGKAFDVELTRKVLPNQSRAAGKMLPSGFAYISLSRFFMPAAALFEKELQGVKDAPGLIIDLRYNGGGNMSEVLKIAGFFFREQASFGKTQMRNEEQNELWSVPSSKTYFPGPIVVLINSFSASGSELLASGLQENARAKIIGSQSCGCLLGINQLRDMKGGSELHISEIAFLSSKGKIYERAGITPDLLLNLTVDDLRTGKDRGIETAEKVLADLLKK